MSRTVKQESPAWFRKEKKPFRKAHLRSHRTAVKRALHAGQEPPAYKRTSGWLTH